MLFCRKFCDLVKICVMPHIFPYAKVILLMHSGNERGKLREIGCAPDFFMRIWSAQTGFRFTTCPFQRHGYYLMV